MVFVSTYSLVRARFSRRGYQTSSRQYRASIYLYGAAECEIVTGYRRLTVEGSTQPRSEDSQARVSKIYPHALGTDILAIQCPKSSAVVLGARESGNPIDIYKL